MSIISYDGDDRVMAFIDLRNMTGSVQVDAGFTRFDFVEMTRHLRGPRKLVGAYIFDSKGILDSGDSSRRFHDYLRYKGFRVMVRDAYDPDRDEQKEVDVAMACKMVVHALKDHYDVAIVVSGDRDFIPAVQEVQAAGKRVEIAAFDNHVSQEMVRAADLFHRLETVPLLTMSNPVPEVPVGTVDEGGDS